MGSLTAAVFSIVIPHRDDLRGLGNTLAGLAAARAASPPFEVVVVDNGSRGGAGAVEAAVRRSGLAARVVSEAQPGAGPARNRGAACATHDLLVFLDCDCVPGEGWLRGIADGLERFDAVGGPVRVRLRGGDPHAATAAELFDLLFGFQSELSFARDGLLLSANLATTRAAFGRVGPFRTGVSEDRDWCARARRLGCSLALVPAPVWHDAVDDPGALRRRWMRVTRESFAFHQAHGRSRARWLAYCLAVGASPLLHGLRPVAGGRLRGASLRRRLDVLRLLGAIRLRRAALGLALLRNPGA